MYSMLCGNLAAIKTVMQQAAAKSGRQLEDITLIGVSKTHPADAVRAAAQCGLKHFGENRVQEAVPKIDSLTDLDIKWHFIGSLQTNKVRYILPKVQLIHSLDRWSLVKELERLAPRFTTQANCLVQVNIAGEASKSGLAPVEVCDFIQAVVTECQHVRICGLMTIAPIAENPEEVRGYFRQMKALFDELAQSATGYTMQHLSMGMSGDFAVAIEEGATMIRVGSAIFGRRRTE